MSGNSSPEIISTKRNKIATLASEDPTRVLTSLAHHIDLEWLREAYRRTRKDGALGVDGVSAKEYEKSLDENLAVLLRRFKSGTYHAPAVKRVYIDKDGGQSKRPIGIPTLEDKILQRAVVMALEPIYEQDFLDCSYGFRSRRSAHDALSSLWSGLMSLHSGWVIDLDIRQFFDNVDKNCLYEILDQRVRDGVIRRVIGKWLNAGVMEDGVVSRPNKGTPQGGVISPLLANIYLHEVLDTWFETQVKPRLRGKAFMVRYADDAVLCFKQESDARRVMAVLDKRLNRFGLESNTAKTRLIRFVPSKKSTSNDKGRASPRSDASFDFLGFTHFWQRSRKGRWVVVRRTASARFSRALKRIREWCKRFRHLPTAVQQVMLNRKLIGHYNYYGIAGNSRALWRFRHAVERVWFYWLGRRSGAKLLWERFVRLIARYPLAPARVVRT